MYMYINFFFKETDSADEEGTPSYLNLPLRQMAKITAGCRCRYKV